MSELKEEPCLSSIKPTSMSSFVAGKSGVTAYSSVRLIIPPILIKKNCEEKIYI